MLKRIAFASANLFDSRTGVMPPHATVVVEGGSIANVLFNATRFDAVQSRPAARARSGGITSVILET